MANADSGVPPSHMDQATDGINALHISEDALPVFTTSQALTETPPPALPHGMLQEQLAALTQLASLPDLARALLQAQLKTVSIPPFWETSAEAWLTRVECTFASAGITDEVVKINHFLSQLEERVAKHVL